MHKGGVRFKQLAAAVIVAALVVALTGLPDWIIPAVVSWGIPSVVSGSIYALLNAYLPPLRGATIGPIEVLSVIAFVISKLIL